METGCSDVGRGSWEMESSMGLIQLTDQILPAPVLNAADTALWSMAYSSYESLVLSFGFVVSKGGFTVL